MEIQKQNYNNLLGELKELEKALENSQLILIAKQNEKEALEIEYDNINREIERKKIEKEKMLNNEKIITVYAIISTILTGAIIVPFIIHFGNKFVTIPLSLEKAKYLGITFFGTLGFGIASIFSLSRLGKIILKMYNKKITNSEEYQKLLETIKNKKEEKKTIEKIKSLLFDECLQATLNYSTQNAMVQIKKAEIERFKSDVSNEVINNTAKTDENTKPYTKVKTRTDKNTTR